MTLEFGRGPSNFPRWIFRLGGRFTDCSIGRFSCCVLVFISDDNSATEFFVEGSEIKTTGCPDVFGSLGTDFEEVTQKDRGIFGSWLKKLLTNWRM